MTPKLTPPQKIVLPYIIIGILYIFFSDRLVTEFYSHERYITSIQTYKGFAFIFLTGWMLYSISKKYTTEIASTKITKANTDILYKALIENAGDITVLTDGEGNILFTSPNSTRFTGYSDNELKNADLTQIIHPDDLNNYFKTKEQILLNPGVIFGSEFRIRHSDGSYKWVESTTVNRLNDPIVKGVITNARDINERKIAEAKLKESELLFSSSFEQIAVGIAYLSINGRWILTNNQLCSITGYNKTEIEQLCYEQLYPSVYKKNALENFNNILNGTTQNYIVEKKIQKKDGSLIWVEQILTLIKDENDKPLYVTIIIKDIDEAKKTESQLAYKNKELDTFIYRSSHDLRGPITTIIGLSDLGVMETNEEKLKEIFSNSGKVALKMEKILDDLMAVTQIKQCKTSIDKIDLKSIVQSTIKGVKNKEGLNKTQLVTNVDSITDIYTDKDLLNIILSQVVENAISFSDSGRQHKVIITAFSNDDTINFAIEDNGTGIHESDLESIFDLYYHGKNTNRGSGIGLYLVKAAIEKLGGNIAVNSKEGMGTDVQISIPNQTNEQPNIDS